MYPGFQQVAYVTNDVDAAVDSLRKAYAVEKWFRVDDFSFAMASGKDVHIQVAIANLGGTQFEIIKPVGGDDAMYRDALDDKPGFQLVFHHLCKVFDEEAQLREHRDYLKGLGVPMPMDNCDSPSNGIAFALYCDFRDTLGHYLEYAWFTDAGREWAKQIPQNG
ncbi:hypothetical protein LK12_17925 [Novosphingobium malaysiense]|uniref:VOC domain-containing protein n=2 Tax=Novosphingobium malaysiense TaxID=1348853 RepID=A0A0B1ZKE1_9SPHN|nr:hypothetical protein LK12_17925 [Novosphingobium malaysiense]